MRWMVTYSVAAAIGAIGLALPSDADASPPNDDYAAAVLLEDVRGDVDGTTWEAGREAGEPAHAGNAEDGSVWYRWVAPLSGRVSFRLIAFFGAPHVAVYVGSQVDALTEVASRASLYETRVGFAAAAGTEYRIAVAGGSPTESESEFYLSWGRAPANDAFADARVVGGPTGAVKGSPFGATDEPSEPPYGPAIPIAASLWYRWVAPRTGHVRFETDVTWTWEDGGMNTVLAVYTGDALGALVPVASNDNFEGFHTLGSAVSFRAIKGRTYSIAVATGIDDDYDRFVLRWYPGVIIYGTAAAEFLRGTPGRDYIAAGGGDDIVKGLGGADVISGGDGADILRGGRGNDVISGGDGADILRGERGDDVISGGDGADILRGGRGNDVLGSRIFGQEDGADVMIGGPGSDLIRGGRGNDRLISRDGVRGNDVVHGGPGVDRVWADPGDRVHAVP